jgi:hypothetical protein
MLAYAPLSRTLGGAPVYVIPLQQIDGMEILKEKGRLLIALRKEWSQAAIAEELGERQRL